LQLPTRENFVVLWDLREASPADINSLALIGSATFLETFAGILDGEAIVAHCKREHSAEAYARYLAGGAYAWLAETQLGNAPVGFSLVGGTDLPGSKPDGTDLELKRIYTLLRFHGSGMGAELMRRAITRAKESGARRLLLGVYAGNSQAQAFYQKNGFERIADRKFRVGDREYEDIVFARTLD
jgi:ribosomal protein S18 acetylase RimI-like enzyme